jgi:hypothetical protein
MILKLLHLYRAWRPAERLDRAPVFWVRRLPLRGSGCRGRNAGLRLHLGRVQRLLAVGGMRNTTAQGSGFVIAVDGDNYILKSMHILAGGMTVLAFDDNWVAAGLTPLEFGDSDALRPGSFVVALGHPFGVQDAVTLGVLSGRIDLPAFNPSSVMVIALTAAIAASVIFVAKALQWWREKTTPTDAKEEYGGSQTWTSTIQVATGGRLLPRHGGCFQATTSRKARRVMDMPITCRKWSI